MDGKEAIIASIISEAEKGAKSLIEDATAEKDRMLETLRNDLEAKKQRQIAKAEADAQELIARRMTLASLEERKTVLAAKQRVVDTVYYQTVSKILNMTDHIYRDFIGGLVAKYAEDGDMIIVSERDARRLHADWAAGLCASTGKRLSLSEERHNGRGGVILAGRKYDKNLTLTALVAELRAGTEGAVIKKLFKAEG